MYTEYYVSASAGGGGVGSEVDPFTIAEAFAHTDTSAIYWVLSGSYTVASATTITTAGTMSGLKLFKGYNTTTGDLDQQGRNTDGSLNTTNFPVLTLTSNLILTSFVFMINFDIVGSYAFDMLGASSPDRFGFINCRIGNTVDAITATLVRGDDQLTLINCDFYTGTGSLLSMIRGDFYGIVYGCKFVVTATIVNAILDLSTVTLVSNWFSGNGQTVTRITGTNSESSMFIGNTFSNCGAIYYNTDAIVYTIPYLINNHATDSAEWMHNGYTTATMAAIEVNNRLRDITTTRTGIADGVVLGEITTDTGGPETDYVNAGTGNLNLISTAPGIDTGLGFGTWNIGASQNENSATPSVGGIIKVNLDGGLS